MIEPVALRAAEGAIAEAAAGVRRARGHTWWFSIWRWLKRCAMFTYWLVAEAIHRLWPWWKWPRLIGILLLMGLRGRLRSENLFDANTLPAVDPVDARDGEQCPRDQRSADGSYNDLQRPAAGMAETRFGRNVPLTYRSTYPLLEPNPREVSDVLMRRLAFVPFEGGNALIAAWIQFMVRDWFNHGKPGPAAWELPRPDTSPRADRCSLPVPKARCDRTRIAGPPTTRLNVLTHWWDGSQIYPSDPEIRRRTRTMVGHSLPHGHIRENLFPILPEPADPDRPPQCVPGSWAGLALMMNLFAKEHNAICDELHANYPLMDGEELYQRARLVNAALMAKIHTLDWTAAVLAHKTTVYGTRFEWWGLLGERMFRRHGRISRTELLSGIPGSATKSFGVPFSLTEEFVAVYRMHQMLPDAITLRAADGSGRTREARLAELIGESSDQMFRDGWKEADLAYSLLRAPAGLVTLNNFPETLRRMNGSNAAIDHDFDLDLAASDILRCRELGVPRYNDLRRALHMKPKRSIDQLSADDDTNARIAAVYGKDIDNVDLLVGLCAEERPPGFAFSDTAFRVFLLMAARRLLSDRFLTVDYREDVYSKAGLRWVEDNSMATVLRRHFPDLRSSLAPDANAFRAFGQ